jgi:hypothetical protein
MRRHFQELLAFAVAFGAVAATAVAQERKLVVYTANYRVSVAQGASRADGVDALLRNRLRQVGEPLRVPLRGSMVHR